MSFRVIEGGKGTPIEIAQRAVIDRVATAIWDAEGEDMQPWPVFAEFVADAHASNSPKMLKEVSDTYRKARAAIAAMGPVHEPVLLQGLAAHQPAEAAAIVKAWVRAVLA